MTSIDRDALKALLDKFADEAVEAAQSSMYPSSANMADDIIALVQPAAGITLTTEEVTDACNALRMAQSWAHNPGITDADQAALDRMQILAARLGAAA